MPLVSDGLLKERYSFLYA